MASSVITPLHEDRVRVRRWEAADTTLEAVMAHLHELHRELTHHDANEQEHPHPRNCVLNLVVAVDEQHRATACDKLVAGLAASHPLRAILIHLHGGKGQGTLDAAITSEAHQLVSGFPVQREQVLLHVRGEAAHHLSSLVEPLLVGDIPTYLWWSGRHRLDEAIVQDAMGFSDALVVDSARFDRPVDALLQLAALVADPKGSIGVADFRWSRMRPVRDAVSQFFGPAERRGLLDGLEELTVVATGTGPDDRGAAALLAGWMAAAMDWRFEAPVTSGADATEADAGTAAGHRVRVTLRSAPNERLHRGELQRVLLAGRRGRRTFSLSLERDPGGDDHGHLEIVFDGGPPVRQRLSLARLGDPDALVHVLWARPRDPVFDGALRAATPLLEAMR